ncbi:chemotaxis protein CheB [Variovorax paradoxus]|nr:chemotaxis protein CheB [Variovorax paradoxus]
MTSSAHPLHPPGRAVFIGASSGGVYAMLELAAALPANFPVPIFLVQHIGAHRSQLAQLLSARGPNPAVQARDGDLPAAGTLHVAPPDHHMLLEGGVIRVIRGPKEHHARPAIDPLFRSAALEMGARAIGVVLTGLLDDGSAGLRAIKDCGGTAVVQDPADAFEPGMPRAALSVVRADHVVPLSEMAGVLLAAARAEAGASGHRHGHAPSPALRREHAAGREGNAMESLKEIATPSAFSCPDCGGVLFELDDQRPVRYRCHTGHAFSLRSLAATQEQVTDAALWTGLRALQEKEAILRRLAETQRASEPEAAAGCDREADELAAVSLAMRSLTMKAPSPASFEA